MTIKKAISKTIAPIALVAVFSPSVLACSEAEAPQLPDPNTAVIAEMVKAQKAVKKYLADQDKFLKCTNNTRRHDSAVDEMHEVADRFNKITKEYKARMKG